MLKTLVSLGGSSSIRGLSTSFAAPKIIMGANALPEVAGLVPGFPEIISIRCPKKRAFIVTDKYVENLANRVRRAMERVGFSVEIWNEAVPEPPTETVKDCAEAMKKFEPDLIMAVGGGSSIDCAKAAWILYERPDIIDIITVSPLVPLGLRKKAILVAIPTTSGTGSECTGICVVSDMKAMRKIPIGSSELVPDFALLIPTFAMGMPPKLTAGTGLDALAHASDAVISRSSNDITDALALRSIQLVFKYLPRAYQNPRDREARYRMHIAASMAGIAFSNGGVGLTHSLGHSLGKAFGIHHGVSVGIFIPYVFQYCSKVTDKYYEICKALDIKAERKEEYLAKLVERFRSLLREMDVPVTLKDLGISKEDFEKNFQTLVTYAYEDPSGFQNPRPITIGEYEKFFRYAYEGKDVDF
jgi:hypothetical protein